MKFSILLASLIGMATTSIMAGGIVNGTLSAAGGGGGVVNATNAIAIQNGIGNNTTLTNATILGGSITGNGSGLTNLASSTNLVYYFDPLATNPVSQVNNPLAPFHNLDSVSTIALTTPATFQLAPGIYYFTNAMTNVSVIGSDIGRTLLVDTNTSVAGIDGQTFEQAVFYIGSISNLTYANLTIGCIPGGLFDLTNYVAIFYGAVESTGTYGITIRNVSVPFSLAAYGIPTGGASLDGGYIRSTNCTVQFNIDGFHQDQPWDCWMNYNKGTNLYTINNCPWNTLQIYVTNANGNIGGAGHCLFFNNPGNGSVVSVNNSIFTSQSTTNIGFPFYLQTTGNNGTNFTGSFKNDSMMNASMPAIANAGDITLSETAGLTNSGGSINVVGGIYDITNGIYFALNSSAFWTTFVNWSYQDWQGSTHLSGTLNASNAIISGNLTVTGNSSLQGTTTMGTVTITNLNWPTTNFMIGQGQINAALPVETLYTNASFTFGLPINVVVGEYNSPVILVTNYLGSLITITPQAQWHTIGTWNCTNWTRIMLDIIPNVVTNALSVPVW